LILETIINMRARIFIDTKKGFTVKQRWFIFWWRPFMDLDNTHNSSFEAENWAKEVYKENRKKIIL